MKLKLKQKAFIAEYVKNGGNGVQAALKVYDTSDYNTANQIARDNLQKPTIWREIAKAAEKVGLHVEDALRTVKEGIRAEDPKGNPQWGARLRASDMTLKLADAYPRDKQVSHHHHHLHQTMIQEFSEKYSFEELTEMMKEEMRNIPAEEIAASPTLQRIREGLIHGRGRAK